MSPAHTILFRMMQAAAERQDRMEARYQQAMLDAEARHADAMAGAEARHADTIARLVERGDAAAVAAGDPDTHGAAERKKQLSKLAKAPPRLPHDVTPLQFFRWRRMWEKYAQMVNLQQHDDNAQRATLVANMSLQMQELLYHQMAVDDDTDLSPAQVLDTVATYLRKKTSIVMDLSLIHI